MFWCKDESKNKLVPLIVETNDIDVTYNEAVLKGDKSIGYITSGGFAHFVNKSIAFSYFCLLYTSPSPRDVEESRMPSSA